MVSKSSRGGLLTLALGVCCLIGAYYCIWNSDFVVSNIVPDLDTIVAVIAGVLVTICIFIKLIFCILIILVTCGISVILNSIIISVSVVKVFGVILSVLGLFIVAVALKQLIK